MDLTEIFTDALRVLQDPTYQQGAILCALPFVAAVAAVGIHMHDQAAQTAEQRKTGAQEKHPAARL